MSEPVLELKLDPARVALGKMLKLVEDGILVRNIANDDDFQTYLMQSNRLVVVLNEAQKVLGIKI